MASSGACNTEAFRLCSEYKKAGEIVDCLKEHEEEVSQACKENLYSRETLQDTRSQEIRLNQLHVTEFITVISIVFLLAQLALAAWALMKFREFYELYSTLDVLSADIGLSEAANTTVAPIEVSFMGLSYWYREKRSWKNPFEQGACVRVLHRAAGRFLPGQVSAIMGPSGSGLSSLFNSHQP